MTPAPPGLAETSAAGGSALAAIQAGQLDDARGHLQHLPPIELTRTAHTARVLAAMCDQLSGR